MSNVFQVFGIAIERGIMARLSFHPPVLAGFPCCEVFLFAD
jgi:hypothetical protein